MLFASDHVVASTPPPADGVVGRVQDWLADQVPADT